MSLRQKDETPAPTEQMSPEWTPLPGEFMRNRSAPRTAPRAQGTTDVLRTSLRELESPLWAIGHLARWLRDDLAGQVDAVVANNLDLLCESVDGMAALLSEVQEYTRADDIDDHSSVVDVVALVREVFRTVAAPETFELEIAEDVRSIVTSRERLRHVLAVVIDNAVRHHDRPDGRIDVAARHDGQNVVFAITDDGPGIAASQLVRVFHPFVTSTHVGPARRAGLGLAIVKHIVERHRGRLDIDSTLGEGTRVTVTLPIERNDEIA